ncbi:MULTISPECIES: CDGSH iron-sulfur domain-containing protein [Bacteroides]|uniref:CDGSH iron-sulfur domain-containing protein n=1 Tax=Bacteroides TaxID=816 RepID=UPI00319E3A67
MPDAEGSSWVYQKGKHFETSENPVHLCRCGQLSNKPFCDGTHASIHFCDNIPLEKGKGEW